MELKYLAIDHPYYASDNNYYSNDIAQEYEKWEDFYEEFNDADVDMNLAYRWDIKECEEGYYMEVFIIQQRKGIYMPILIKSVTEKDSAQIKEYLKPHFEKLLEIWNPLTNEFLSKR